MFNHYGPRTFNPGTIIGRKTNVYPLSLVRGYIGPNKIYKNQNEIVEKI